jgi:hypothetical protein
MTPNDSLFAGALRRMRRRAAGIVMGAPALIGTVGLAGPQLACTAEPMVGEEEAADWAQYEGQRRTDMVSYTGTFWSECKQPNTRFGCGSVDLVLKVRVRPVAGANIDWKRVGVVYRSPFDPTERTANARYFTTWGDGDEEWHVPVSVPTWQRTILFDVWYQDGAGHTYFDDNFGELHVANDGHDSQVMRMEPWRNTLQLTEQGLKGSLSLQLMDLDYDKEIQLVGTTDDWQTVIELGMGGPGSVNRWYWAEDYAWSANERWQIDIDIPGAFSRFEYAVVYRHGVVGGARTYSFWDNNFNQNYFIVGAVE